MTQSLQDIIKAAAKMDGQGTGPSEIRVHVTPASFKSDGRGRYDKGEIVRQCRVGRLNVSAYAVEAILQELAVWDKVEPARIANLFALPNDS